MGFTRDWISSWILDHSKFKTQPSYVRGLMDDVGERLADYLYGFTSGETFTGFKKIGLITIGTGSGSIPTGTGVQAAINLQGKTIDGKVELVTIDADGNEIQFTSKGHALANNKWLSASDAAGTGGVNILKVNTAGGIEFESSPTVPGIIVTGTGTGLIPSGGIIMWSGAIAAIPSGWVLCNGSNGTPDLRDRFIVGATSDDSGVAKTNVTGSLTQSGDGSIPAHTHNMPYSTNANDPAQGVTRATSMIGNLATGSYGSGTKNIAVYYALAFIMKT